MAATPTMAQAAPLEFTIIAVGNDIDADKAQDYAVDYARKRAVYLAVAKLGIADPGDVAAHIPADKWPEIVRGATVLRTKREGEKTTAEVQVSILEGPLRHVLKVKETGAATPMVDPATLRSVLVLPAIVTPKKTLVWEKENTLRAPLSSELLRQAHGAVMLPGGDLQDLRLIDGQNITKVKPDELKPMFERYGTDEIIIAILTPGTLQTMEPDKVQLRRLTSYGPQEEILEIKPTAPDDTAEARMTRDAQAVATAAVQIASSTTQSARAKLDAATKIPVHFIYTIPKELGTMTNIIRNAPGVLQLDMPAIELNNVTGVIYLNGDKAALRKVLAAKGVISRDKGDEWTLSVR